MDSLDFLAAYASSCNYRHNEYKRGPLVDRLTTAIEHAESLKDLSPHDRAVLKVSIDTLRDHAKKSHSNFWARFFTSQKRLGGVIRQLESLSDNLANVPITGERAFRIQFLAQAPKTLRIKHAPSNHHINHFTWRDGSKEVRMVDEHKAVNWLSNAVYNSTKGDWNRYHAIMVGAYRGDHLLIEDDPSHQKADQLTQCGTILRGSSHYERGRPIKEWKDGQPVFAPEGRESFVKAKEPHHGITGDHVRHILFNRVEMYHTKDGKIIPAKTATQVQHLFDAKKPVRDVDGNEVKPEEVKKRHYVALQFESSADSDGNNLLDIKFYTHRILGFITYRIRKLLGIQKANIGAYGYGVTDMKPIIISK